MSKEQVNQIKIHSAFCPVELPPQLANDPVSEEDIVDTLIIDSYEQDEKGNITPVTKQIVTGKKNRKAYIESFSDDVGLTNILEKIGQGAIAEDKFSIMKSNTPGQVTDLRGFDGINGLADIEALASKARNTFANLDKDLKGNMSFAEFCTKFGNDDLNKYIQSKVEALKVKNEQKKEGE